MFWSRFLYIHAFAILFKVFFCRFVILGCIHYSVKYCIPCIIFVQTNYWDMRWRWIFWNFLFLCTAKHIPFDIKTRMMCTGWMNIAKIWVSFVLSLHVKLIERQSYTPPPPHTHTHTHTYTHIHVWGGFRGIGYLAAKLGTWIIPHFHCVYSYDVPRNIAISRPKMCKKIFTQQIWFSTGYWGKNRTL